MPHDTALIGTVAAGLGLAFVFGLLATRLRLPPILGYLVAGMVVGPFTPGYVADTGLASQLAEIGVILLMFGVGLHFSIADLLAVRRIAVPGAIAQIGVATGLGALLAHAWGWSWGSGIVFGLSLSVASTVVLLRALEDRNALESADGRIAVGWLIVEDLVTVLALVVLPMLAPALGGTTAAGATGGAGLWGALGLTVLKVAAFVTVMLVVGRRVVPWVLGQVVKTRSRELFTLAVLAVALGTAVGVAGLFDVSFALGAFFAGVVVSETDFSHEAATNAMPLQDAFAVLFFVSVGMLFDPRIVLEQPLETLAVLGIIVIGKSVAALGLVLAFRYSITTALRTAVALAQIGEFSFILAALGVGLGILPREAQSLVVAGAILSITIHPFLFHGIPPLTRWLGGRRALTDALEREPGPLARLPEGLDPAALRDHAIVIGYGRVGEPVVRELARHGVPHVVVEQSQERLPELRALGLPVLHGEATRPEVLRDAGLDCAKLVLVATGDAFEGRAILSLVKQLNPAVEVIVRTHSDDERKFLEGHGATAAMVGERELAVSMARQALRRFAVPHDMAEVAARALGRADTSGGLGHIERAPK